MKLIVKTLALGAALLMVGCASTSKTSNTAMQIERGMSYQQGMSLVSDYPLERTFRGRGTAVQFCGSNGTTTPDFVIVWMVDDEVEALTQYKARAVNFMGCESGFREIDWGQAPADVKIALDIR